MNMPLEILGIGKALPSQCLSSQDLDVQLGLTLGYIERISGLRQRYFLAKNESADTMILTAAHEALKRANLSIDDIDCIISASAGMRQAIPFNAAHISRLLGGQKAVPGFDINMTCLSTLRAMEVAAFLLPLYPRILIVSCDIASVGLDWNRPQTAGIFGDGAAALVLTSSQRGGLIAGKFAAYPEGYEFCMIPGGGYHRHPTRCEGNYTEQSYFQMDGKRLYRLVAANLPTFLDEVLAQAGLHLSDIDWVVPHQASRGSLNHIVDRLGIASERLIDIFDTHGNQVAASLPTALYHLLCDYPIKSGDKVLLVGTSAGLGFGALIWEKP